MWKQVLDRCEEGIVPTVHKMVNADSKIDLYSVEIEHNWATLNT